MPNGKILDGKKLSQEIKNEIKDSILKISNLGIIPRLDVILVGGDIASSIYVKHKRKDCKEVGILSMLHEFDGSITEKELENEIDKLNTNNKVSGILLQLPLPKHINENKIINRIHPSKDVDGFTNENIGNMIKNEKTFYSCTPYGIIEMLKRNNIGISGKNAVIIGRSNVVGKPMYSLLLNHDATVTICHSKTKNLSHITKMADILICAIGKPLFVTADMVKEGAVVIDVGINRKEDGKLVGDVDFGSVKEKASYITPVPGGVGPMTRAMLLKNTFDAFMNKKKND